MVEYVKLEKENLDKAKPSKRIFQTIFLLILILAIIFSFSYFNQDEINNFQQLKHSIENISKNFSLEKENNNSSSKENQSELKQFGNFILNEINNSHDSKKISNETRKELIFKEINNFKGTNNLIKLSKPDWDKADEVAKIYTLNFLYEENYNVKKVFSGSYKMSSHYSNFVNDVDCGTEYLDTNESVISKIKCLLEVSKKKNPDLLNNIKSSKKVAIGFYEGWGGWYTITFVFK